MEFAIWAYPWDVRDEGPGTVADRLAEIGVGEINLATNYHTVQAFLPHNPNRRTFFSHASSFFQPGPAYADLQPVPNERMDDADWVAEIAGALPEAIRLTSWTIGCHNTRLGEANPDCTLTTPFGDDLVFGLCPSHPRVQQYLRDLVADLDGRSSFDRIELESFDYFHGRGFGWHHDKFHARLGDLGEFLFGVCFCRSCRDAADEAGVDVEAARSACRDAIDDIAAGRQSHRISPEAWVRGHPAVDAYLSVREDTLVSMFGELRDATDAELGYYPLLSPDRAWMHGADLARLSEHLDYVKAIAYESSPDDVRQVVETAAALTPEIPIHAGLLPAHPHVHDCETARSIVDAARDAGVERISFYNYGMLPERNLDWIGEITAD